MLRWLLILWLTLAFIGAGTQLMARAVPLSLAWMLLLWLAPPVLVLLYLRGSAGRRKVQAQRAVSRPSRLDGNGTAGPEPVDLPGRRELPKLSPGNAVSLSASPVVARQWLRGAIRSAHSFIHIEYHFSAHDFGLIPLFDELRAAHDRGVEVRLLYDGLGPFRLRARSLLELMRQGVEAASFKSERTGSSPAAVSQRNHRRLLLVDGSVCILGGGQTTEEGSSDERHPLIDHAVLVRGPVCRDLQPIFAKDWERSTGKTLRDRRYFPPVPVAGELNAQVIDGTSGASQAALHHVLLLTIGSAKRCVRLVTPNFVPGEPMVDALTAAAGRGVDVELILPERGHGESLLTFYASRSYFEELLRAGIKIYLYQSALLTTNLLLVDSAWTVLGSANFDHRSFYVDLELNLLVEGPHLAGFAHGIFEQERRSCRRLHLEEIQATSIQLRLLETACRAIAPVL